MRGRRRAVAMWMEIKNYEDETPSKSNSGRDRDERQGNRARVRSA